MRSPTAAWLTALAVLVGTACAGSGRNQSSGAAPLDTVHIRSADTLPGANGAGAMRSDTATHDSVGAIDTTKRDSVQRSGADTAR
jgi:hypothetical protein